MPDPRIGGPEPAPSPAPAPAPVVDDKKILGRFTDQKELESSYTTLEKRFGEFSEDNKILQTELEIRDERVRQLEAEAKARVPVAPGTVEVPEGERDFVLSAEEQQALYGSPAGATKVLESFGKRIYNRAVKDMAAGSSQVDQQRNYEGALRGAFYKDNPDLVGKELVVGAIGTQIQLENPRVPPHMLLGRVAERTRTYITELGGKEGMPPGTRVEGDQTREGIPPVKTDSVAELDKSITFQKGR